MTNEVEAPERVFLDRCAIGRAQSQQPDAYYYGSFRIADGEASAFVNEVEYVRKENSNEVQNLQSTDRAMGRSERNEQDVLEAPSQPESLTSAQAPAKAEAPKNTKSQTTKAYKEHLRERLNSFEDIEAYLLACHDDSPEAFTQGLHDVLDTRADTLPARRVDVEAAEAIVSYLFDDYPDNADKRGDAETKVATIISKHCAPSEAGEGVTSVSAEVGARKCLRCGHASHVVDEICRQPRHFCGDGFCESGPCGCKCVFPTESLTDSKEANETTRCS